MQSHPLLMTHFGQYKVSSAALGWLGDWECYFMRRIQSGGWAFPKDHKKAFGKHCLFMQLYFVWGL